MCFIWQQRRVDRILSSTFVTNGGNIEAVGNPNQTNIVFSIADGPTQFLPSVRELFISDSNFRNEVNRDPGDDNPGLHGLQVVEADEAK